MHRQVILVAYTLTFRIIYIYSHFWTLQQIKKAKQFLALLETKVHTLILIYIKVRKPPEGKLCL
jgi:hypothetical protein